MLLSEALFVPWRRAWIVHEDASILVVDKPAGIATHAADPTRGDDAVSRLTDFLATRDGLAPAAVYLGVHQRLDKGTSGVLLFARDRRANAALAAAFANRVAQKRYLAVVEPAPRGPPSGTLAHLVERGEAEAMRARPVLPRDRVAPDDPRLALTRYELLRREGSRALMAFTPETGRTHQIRVQAAAAAMPLVGDTLYGGVPAPRLMLHAHALGLPHPEGGGPVRFTAPLPAALEAALMGHDEPISLRDKLFRAADARWHLARDPATTAFRLAHDGDGFADCPVDVYDRHAVLNVRGPRHDPALARALLDAGFVGVYAKYRPKQANTLVSTRREDLAPPHAVAGDDAPADFTIVERGTTLRVRLGDGLSTGVFLDQRENRARVRAMAAGLRVLNLFAYTGPFTVAAALGGAARTVSVDVSREALAWCGRNLEANAIARDAHALVAQDVFAWLTGARARGDRFDLVVCDPPSYSNTRESRFASASDYRALVVALAPLLAPGGRLLACSNHRGIPRLKFRRHLHESLRAAGREVTQMKDLPPPDDFPPAPGEEPYLKAVLVSLS